MPLLGLRRDRYMFLQLCVCIWVSIANGSMFCFSLFTPDLKALRFSTTEITTVSTIGALASYMSLPTGYIYDRLGPTPTLAIGGIVNLIGWLLMYLFFSRTLPQNIYMLCACYCVSQLGASFYETGSVLSNLDAFELHQGNILIIQRAFVGLGTSIITMVYYGFFVNLEIKWFILFLVAFSSTAGALGALIIRLPEGVFRVEGFSWLPSVAPLYVKPLRVGVGLVFVAVGFISVVNIIEAYHSFPEQQRQIFGGITVAICLAFLMMLLFVPSRGKLDEFIALGEEQDAFLSPARSEIMTIQKHIRSASPLSKNLKTLNLWLLWYISFVVWGASLMVNVNSSLIYEAVAGEMNKTKNALWVSVFGVANAIGRIVIGALDSWLLDRGIPIWNFLPVTPLVMCAGLVSFVILPAEALILPFALIGLGTGFTWASTVLVVKRLYAQTGTHYNFLYTAGAITPFAFSSGLFAQLFEKESRAQHQPSSNRCIGTECIGITMFTAAGLNFVAVIAGFIFLIKIRRQASAAVDELEKSGVFSQRSGLLSRSTSFGDLTKAIGRRGSNLSSNNNNVHSSSALDDSAIPTSPLMYSGAGLAIYPTSYGTSPTISGRDKSLQQQQQNESNNSPHSRRIAFYEKCPLSTSPSQNYANHNASSGGGGKRASFCADAPIQWGSADDAAVKGEGEGDNDDGVQ